MFGQRLNHFATKIKSLKACQAIYRLVTVVVHHALLASLFYLPRCMQARAEHLVQNASHLEDEYQAFSTLKDGDQFKRRASTLEAQVEWLNDDPTQRMSLRTLEVGWKKHVEHCQARWMKVLGCFVAITIALIDTTAGRQNQVLVSLLLVRGAVATLHLAAFHIIVYPELKELDFLMKCVSGAGELLSPLWLSLSIPLASILWSIFFAFLLAIDFICNPPTITPAVQQLHFTASTVFVCIVPDILPIAWIYYQFRYLH